MPKWGLTEAQRKSQPWGLAADLLEPSKVITDPVHGDIYLTRLETYVLDSPPMQRLRRIRQLGTSHLVYPGAGHSRLSHALGTLRAAQDLLDAVVDNRTGPRRKPDLLSEWVAEDQTVFDRKVAEATVLARLGALMHDLCHVPLGHTIEDDLRVLTPHDGNVPRFERLWAELDPRVLAAFGDADPLLVPELRMLILSKEEGAAPERSRYPFVSDIVGNTICADLIDYLRRDHWMTGLPSAVGDRFVNEFYVMGSHDVDFKHRMVVRVTRGAGRRTDVVTELLKYLRYRYELTERVLTHHAKTAADAMIGKLLEMWHEHLWLEAASEQHAKVVARLGRSDAAAVAAAIAEEHPEAPKLAPGQPIPGDSAPLGLRNEAVRVIDERVRDLMEAEFTSRSDDGLLEYLATLGAGTADERLSAVRTLATDVLNRHLYKMVGRTHAKTRNLALKKFEMFGSAAQRRELEREAARWADVQPGWKIVVWLPEPKMRLKVAEVLVEEGSVETLATLSTESLAIVENHKALWAITVYAAPDVCERQSELVAPSTEADRSTVGPVDIALAFLKDKMGIDLVYKDGRAVLGLDELAVQAVSDYLALSRKEREQLNSIRAAAKGGEQNFESKLRATWAAARPMRPESPARMPKLRA
jgi:HD superfamily phosphohydrolase